MSFLPYFRNTEQRIKVNTKEYNEINEAFSSDASKWSEELNARFEELKELIDADENLWLELHEKIDQIESRLEAG